MFMSPTMLLVMDSSYKVMIDRSTRFEKVWIDYAEF